MIYPTNLLGKRTPGVTFVTGETGLDRLWAETRQAAFLHKDRMPCLGLCRDRLQAVPLRAGFANPQQDRKGQAYEP
jgi:hypothetical protein